MFEKRHKDAGSLEVRSVGFFFSEQRSAGCCSVLVVVPYYLSWPLRFENFIWTTKFLYEVFYFGRVAV